MSTRFVVDALVPVEEVSLLAGASGVGKSTLLMQMLSAIVNGEAAFMGHAITYPQRIAYIAADRSWASYRDLAARVGLDLTVLQSRSVVDDDTIDVNRIETGSMDLLYSLISAFDHPTLVVVDPTVLFLGCDPNRYQQVAPRLIKMARWCKRNHFTLLGTHHATKARSDYSFMRAQDRISGSSALLGFSSSQLFLAGADEIKKPYAEFTAINHNAPPETLKLGRDTHGLFVPWEGDTVNPALAALVVKTLSTAEKATRTQLQTATRIDPRTLDDLLETLVGMETLSTNRKGEFRLVDLGRAH